MTNNNLIIDFILKEARIDKKAVEFSSQEALDKYLKDHPDADKSLHSIKKTDTKKELKQKQKELKRQVGREKRGKNFAEKLNKRNLTEQYSSKPAKETIKNLLTLGMDGYRIDRADIVETAKYISNQQTDPDKKKYWTDIAEQISKAKLEYKRHPYIGRLVLYVNNEPTEKIT